MTDFDSIWRTQDEIRTVVNAVLGECDTRGTVPFVTVRIHLLSKLKILKYEGLKTVYRHISSIKDFAL